MTRTRATTTTTTTARTTPPFCSLRLFPSGFSVQFPFLYGRLQAFDLLSLPALHSRTNPRTSSGLRPRSHPLSLRRQDRAVGWPNRGSELDATAKEGLVGAATRRESKVHREKYTGFGVYFKFTYTSVAATQVSTLIFFSPFVRVRFGQ